MAQLAFYTFGVLREQRGHPQVQGFFDLIPSAFAAAQATDGFIGRRSGDRPPTLGPRFWSPESGAIAPQTLSLWRDLESVFAFAYKSAPHAQALRSRHEWAVKPAWPTYVAWWVEDGELPAWEEAVRRLEHLHDHGSTPHAFDFKRPFDAHGNAVTVDKSRAWQPVAAAASAG